ncbi:DELLA protein DWARF8 [Linum perenne]
MSMSSPSIDLPSLMNNPFDLSLSGLSYQDATRVELVEYLMAAAEKVGNKRHDQATHLLDLCDCLSSKTGDPVQRIVYYFSQALRERVDCDLGRNHNRNQNQNSNRVLNAEKALAMIPLQLIQSVQEKIPFHRVAHMSGIQILLENVGNSKRIHVIDLQIRTGLQWTAMMQALASKWERPIELLKITAVGTSNLRNLMEGTGMHLTGFAQTMRIPFCFRTVVVSDILELQEEMFEIDSQEALAVYSEGYLRNLIAVPDRMDSLMKLMRSFNPRIMVVMELEANYNSLTFAQRFVEALFSFSAIFDCLNVCLEGTEDNNDNRTVVESTLLREWIRNVLVKEGEEREFRSVRLNVWRTFFARFAMAEAKMSAVVLYQAKLVLKKVLCGKYCKVDVDGRSLIVGWKDTPILSISSWKFGRMRKEKEEAFE